MSNLEYIQENKKNVNTVFVKDEILYMLDIKHVIVQHAFSLSDKLSFLRVYIFLQ